MKEFSLDIVNFLSERPLISVSGLEKDAKVPKNVLLQAVNGTRNIPFKYIFGIYNTLRNYGFDEYADMKVADVWDYLKEHSTPIDKSDLLKIIAKKRAGKRK